jgi:hypothetical protein
MREVKNLIRNIIKVLDSQPGRRRGARGQSLVELTLTAPILFIMIISAVEVGFLANNYLILLDAVREGGRFAVTENPLQWATSPLSATGDPETRSWERTSTPNRITRLRPGSGRPLRVLRRHRLPGGWRNGPASLQSGDR